jgi:hypothetical protein
MGQKFKIDKDFLPCPVDDGDEIFPNGFFEFNITKMLEYIHGNSDQFPIVEVAVDDFCKEFSVINEPHMDSVEIDQPVILAEIAPGRYNLIDGNHRMEKARRLGIEKMRAYRLNAEQHIRFLTSKEAYLEYINYWNSKLKSIR